MISISKWLNILILRIRPFANVTEWWEQRIIFLLIFPPENSNSIFFSSLKVYNIPKICAVFSTFSLQLTNDFLASFSWQKNLMRFYFYIFYIKSPLKKFKWEEKKHILWNSKISSWETTNQIAMWILKFRVDSPWRVILENPVALWKFKAALKMGWDRQPFKGNFSHYFEWYGLNFRVIFMTSTINQPDSKIHSSQMLSHGHI